MKCSQCGTELPGSKLFCPECGHFNSLQEASAQQLATAVKPPAEAHQTSEPNQLKRQASHFETLIILQFMVFSFAGFGIQKPLLFLMVGLGLVSRLFMPKGKSLWPFVAASGLFLVLGQVFNYLSIGELYFFLLTSIGLGLLAFATSNKDKFQIRDALIGGAIGLVLSFLLYMIIMFPYIQANSVPQYITSRYRTLYFVISIAILLVLHLLVIIASKNRSISMLENKATLIFNAAVLITWILLGSLIQGLLMGIFVTIFISA